MQFQRVADEIRRAIEQGRWHVGEALPSERKTAEEFGVSRSTVRRAWEELQSLGYVHWTAASAPIVVNIPLRPVPINPSLIGKDLPYRPSSTFLSDLMSAASSSARYNFEIGMPDPDLLPIHELQEIVRDLLSQHVREVFSYSPTQGIARVRQALSEEYLSRRGVAADPDNILITSGSLQGLDYVTSLLSRAGDYIVTESPTFAGALQIFASHGAQVLAVPMDEEGIRVEPLAQALAQHPVRMIYVQTFFHNPTSTVMSLARRQAVLALSQKYQVPIVEDDAYGFLATANPQPLYALAPGDAPVIYLNTLSKLLAPGLRVGMVVAPRDIIQYLSQRKQLGDLHTGTVTQLLVEGWLRSGNVTQHIARAQTIYASRMRIASELIRRRGLFLFGHPTGGFYLFVQLPKHINAYALHDYAAQRDVLFAPGEAFGIGDRYRGWIRLCVSALGTTAIQNGMARFFRMLDTFSP
ncbi:MAG: PLP-dependent aminotransferase family protein [Sulfobacillus thermosulfidooxidans]|nr:PLP-dependent aminotransferase family protein [Sulfobacillus sp. hq2]MCY0907407.1 PLP-dependent aminotransferase family protein [Sulfobacillus thermotolerans]PSR37106.1 MAG: PLP-dependent aminotransferase family protein [Sulfobacillus thermosulfidooxidans]